MPYVDDDEPPGMGFQGARPGVSATDLAFDEPGVAADWGGTRQGAASWGDEDGDGVPDDGAPSYDDAEPPLWPVLDGAYFRLPAPVWGRWRGRPRLHRGLGGMLRRARRVGTVRHRGSGARFPVYRGSAGRQSWRVVGRPAAGRSAGRSRELEIVALELEAPQPELEGEAFPVDAGAFSRPARYGGAPRFAPGPRYGGMPRFAPGPRFDGGPRPAGGPGFDGGPRPGGGPRFGGGPRDGGVPRGGGRPWRLSLPHRGLHTVLSRLRPEQLRGLAGGDLPPDPAPAVVQAVERLARRARPAGRLSGGFTVFATPGWRLLVRPLGELQGEIVAVRPVEGEDEANAPFGG